jgi:hypothetical protein
MFRNIRILWRSVPIYHRDLPCLDEEEAGQTTYPGFGVAPSAMSGIFAAESLLNSKNI